MNFVIYHYLKPEDWYTVRLTDMHEMGWPKGVGTVRLAALLKEKYPQHKDWEKIIFMKGKFALQKHLERAIKTLFPVTSSPPFASKHHFEGGDNTSQCAKGNRHYQPHNWVIS